ncbi:GNAT family N-acetyltransferase [Psychrobacillus glaciei]|uniref:GNAT family N-acetyltransferase n=1 Tax=Psychrobacillus glaciei TaxID=2283160 RepID=A0A5J6SPG4_9BACI|nr:GNAT family N-acetyltransferase [Psychrobacillus glaciei]QFF99373.1 GNAT family N-acetyltransferase [Psychrobacillus glaciei]
MKIREAKLDDAAGIAKVHVDCWRTSYQNIMPNDYLEILSYEQRTELWIKNISREGNNVFVAEDDEGQIVGFTDGGIRENNNVENSGNLTTIYILETYQGIGIGKKLLQKLFAACEKLQFSTIFVEVLENNKSKNFYEAVGAELLQSDKVRIAGTDINLLVYQWRDFSRILSSN